MSRRRAILLAGAALLVVVTAATTAYAVSAPQPITLTGCFNPTAGTIDKLKWARTPLAPCDPGERIVKVSGGDITSVLTAPGSGLSGGGATGDLNLSIDFASLDARYVNEAQAESVSASMLDHELSTQVRCAGHAGYQVDFSFCTLNGVNFSNTNMSGANLSNATVRVANLSGAALDNANLSNATLIGTNLSSAKLLSANLQAADLGQTDLRLTDLRNVDLSNSFLDSANLTGATMTGAILTGVFWGNTTCPDGTNSDAHGNTCEGHL